MSRCTSVLRRGSSNAMFVHVKRSAGPSDAVSAELSEPAINFSFPGRWGGPLASAPSLSERPTTTLLDQYRLDPDSSSVLVDRPAGSDRRKVILAVSLLLLGSVLIIIGANVFFLEQKGGIPLLVVGSLAFLPGSYYSYVALQTCRGKEGFALSMIPDV